MSETLGADELLDRMRALARERARIDAEQVRVMARFARLRRQEVGAGGDYASDEIAVELNLTPVAASRRVGVAEALVGRLPDTVEALARGDIDLPKAEVVEQYTSVLPADKASMVEAVVLKFAPGRTVRQLRDKLAREIIKIDPCGAEQRRREAAARVEVRFRPCPEGMAELSVYDRAERLRPIYDLLTNAASTATAAGARDHTDDLRAQALHDLVLGPNRERVTTELRVTIPASALAGASSHPAELHGYGPTTLDTIHELADQNLFWRRIVTDPIIGQVLDVGRRRRHNAAIGEHVRTRDRTCVFPGCPRPAEDSHIDHTTDHARGGHTAIPNLGALCPRHNQMKSRSAWTLTQPEAGHFVWTTPTGTTHHITPEPLIEPDAEPACGAESMT